MEKITLNLPSKKLLVIAVGALLAIYLLWYGLMAMMFSAADMRTKTLAALSQHLGVEVTAIKQQQFSLMPFPKLTLNSVQVKNHPKARYPSLLTARGMEIHPTLGSIFGELVVAVTLYGPKLEFETFADKTHSWQMDVADKAAPQEIALLQNIHFEDTQLHYANPTINRDVTIDDLSFSLQFDSAQAYTAQGKFKLARDVFHFAAQVSGDGTRDLTVGNSSSTYKLAGKWDEAAESFIGKQTLKSKDIGQLLEVFLIAGEQAPQLAADSSTHVPANFASDVKLKGKRITLSNVALDGQLAEGGGQALILLNSTPQVSAQLDLKKFSLAKLESRKVFEEFISQSAKAGENEYRVSLADNRNSSLPKGLNFTLSLKSDQAKFQSLDVSSLQLAAKLSDGSIDIAQFSGKLAQAGQFIVKGKVEGSYDGLAFKGVADVAGKEFAAIFQPLLEGEESKILTLPEHFKRFRGKANLYVNPSVLRLSEVAMRIEAMQIRGTVVRQNVANATKYEGAFRLENIDIDSFNAENSTAADEEKLFDKEALFTSLKQLIHNSGNNRYNFKLNFVDAVLNGNKLANADVRLLLNRQFIGLEEMAIPYNKTLIRGNVRTEFLKDRPKIDANIVVDRLDTESFFGKSFADSPSMWRDENGQWSHKEFNILWLGEADINLTLKAGEFKHAEYELSNVDGIFKIQDGEFNVPKFKANVWGGLLDGRGKMLIAKLPTFNANIRLSGFDFSKLHNTTDLFSNLYGAANITSEISTTGVNPHSAIKNMKGTMSFAGSGLKVKGFNLANMVRAANAVRTVRDIEKLVTYANRGGETKITTVQGNMNIDNGLVRTPRMQISTPVGSGSIKGQINLIDWDVNVGISISLSALQRENPPNIRLLFVGPLQEVGRSLDTQSLESFIAKQAAERLLVNP